METDLIFSEAATWGFRLFERLIESNQSAQLLAKSTGNCNLSKLVATSKACFACPLSYDTDGDEVIRITLKRINSSLSLLHYILSYNNLFLCTSYLSLTSSPFSTYCQVVSLSSNIT